MRQCQNQSGHYPTGANLEYLHRQGEANRARSREEQRARLTDLCMGVLIWIVTPLIGAGLAIGLVWFGIVWLRSH